jgi:formaldehyde-activating enzyme involved in methanogenesis
MKYSITLLIFTFCSLRLFCQHASVSISNEFKVKENGFKDQTVTHSIWYNENFYTATNSGISGLKMMFTKLYDVAFSVTVTRYDRDMRKVQEVELENAKRNFGPLQPSLLCFSNKLFLAYFKAADKASFSLYLARIDENDLSLGEPLKICTIQQENVGYSQIMSIIEGGLVYFAMSSENTRLLVACKSAPGKVQTMVLNDSLRVLCKATVPVNLNSFDIPSAVLTNDNGACLVLHSEEGTRILGIGPGGQKTEIRYNAVGGMAPNNCRAEMARDAKVIIIFGTASNSPEPSRFWCGGFIIARLDAVTFKMSKPLAYSFDEGFLQSAVEKGGGIKHKQEFSLYDFNPLLVEMDNGEIVIIGSPEATTQQVSQSAPNMQNQTETIATTTFHVGPILVLYPNMKGKTFDQVIIPRQIEMSKSSGSGHGAIQVAVAPGIASGPAAGFFATPLGEDIVIVYNDNTKNLAESVDEKVKVSKWASDLELGEALINKERKLEYRKLISQIEKRKCTYYLGDAIATNSGSIIFPIGKEPVSFGGVKAVYTNWCFLTIK